MTLETLNQFGGNEATEAYKPTSIHTCLDELDKLSSNVSKKNAVNNAKDYTTYLVRHSDSLVNRLIHVFLAAYRAMLLEDGLMISVTTAPSDLPGECIAMTYTVDGVKDVKRSITITDYSYDAVMYEAVNHIYKMVGIGWQVVSKLSDVSFAAKGAQDAQKYILASMDAHNQVFRNMQVTCELTTGSLTLLFVYPEEAFRECILTREFTGDVAGNLADAAEYMRLLMRVSGAV